MPEHAPDAATVPADLAREQIESVLRAWGMAEEPASTTALVMTETDLAGVDSHGISMLPIYDQLRREGELNLHAKPRVVREGPGTALLDADAGLGHPVSVRAMHLAVDKSRTQGIAAVSVVNSHHFGAAGYYAGLAAERGVVGFVTSSTRTVAVVPARGAEPVLGTNPMAWAAPAGHNPPVLLDMATSVAAVNKVKVRALHGGEIPSGWVVDGEGRPVTDAAAAYDLLRNQPQGGLSPLGGTEEMGGHKGYGLALFAHILGGALGGGAFAPLRDGAGGMGSQNLGHLFLAIDPEGFRAASDFRRDVDVVVDRLRETRPADPHAPVLVAGDPERAARSRRLEGGIPIPAALRADLRQVAEAAGVAYVLG
ncbi:MAG: Ldh family oxidoreductase [Candidatus Dormibacteraeota bacterium]|nr:Ldh family oxidoreductase [Candidatus Dormibacteraeota bacterium]MBO0759850.1 Ldh family oxidoreductase [Candidatus Dormibacteraeota bacterium]